MTTRTEPFFTNPDDLANLFTPPAWVAPEGRKFAVEFEGEHMKAVEAFHNDIAKNLQTWACENGQVFYRTKQYWYCFQPVTEGELAGVVWMTRYRNGTWERVDDWCNPHSVGVGKEFLKKHRDKRVPLFNA